MFAVSLKNNFLSVIRKIYLLFPNEQKDIKHAKKEFQKDVLSLDGLVDLYRLHFPRRKPNLLLGTECDKAYTPKVPPQVRSFPVNHVHLIDIFQRIRIPDVPCIRKILIILLAGAVAPIKDLDF